MDDFPGRTGPPAPSLQAALLDYFSAPGKYQLSLRQPSLLFASIREVLHIAAGRGGAVAQQEQRGDELREAAMFFVRAALLYPGADHYAVLGLSPEAEPRDLKDRYRLLMRLIHPDFAAAGPITWPSDAATRVNRAYEVLSSPVLRREYDEQLAAHQVLRPPAAKPLTHAPVLAARRPELRRRRRARQRAWTFGLIVAGATILILSTRQEPTHLVQRSPAPAAERTSQALKEDELPPRAPPPAPPQGQPRHAPGPAAAPAPQRAGLAASTPAPHAPPVVATPRAPIPAPRAQAELPPPGPSAQAAHAPPLPAPGPSAQALPAVPLPAPGTNAQALQATPSPAPRASVQATQAAAVPAPRASVQVAVPAPAALPAPAASPAAKAAVAASSLAPLPALAGVPVPASSSAPSTVAGPTATTQQNAPLTVLAVVSPTLNDAQPVLTNLLQLLETGRGDQLLRLLEPSARNAPAAVELSRNFDLLVKGARPVRLAYVHFEGEPHDGVLLVTGRIRLYAGDPTIGATAQAFHVRAEFVSRGGKVKLIALSSAPD